MKPWKNPMIPDSIPTERPWYRLLRPCLLLVALPLAALTGCSGAATRAPQVSISPDLIRNGGRVYAGVPVGFAANIDNKPLAPRYVVEKPVNEPVFNPDAAVTWKNTLRGTVDSVSGVYTPPSRLASDANRLHFNDANQNGFRDTAEDNLIVNRNLDPGEDANGNSKLDQEEAEADGPNADPVPLREIVSVISQDTYNNLTARINVFYNRYSNAFKEVDTFDKALVVAREMENGKLQVPLRVLEDIWLVSRGLLKNPNGFAASVDDAKAISFQRLVASLPRLEKSSVAFVVLHRVVADPVQADVSIRGTVRVSDYVTVPGDQEQYPVSGSVLPLSEVAKHATGDLLSNKRVLWSIDNPANGAGGHVDDDGNYIAPNTLPRDASGNLVIPQRDSSGKLILDRRLQDVIIATSTVDNRQTARITVTVVTGDAPSSVIVK